MATDSLGFPVSGDPLHPDDPCIPVEVRAWTRKRHAYRAIREVQGLRAVIAWHIAITAAQCDCPYEKAIECARLAARDVILGR